jgi:transposase
MDLTDEQWKVVVTHLTTGSGSCRPRGRPGVIRRKVLAGVLWILRTGAPWQDLPPRYGSYQTAHRRFQNWVRSGVIERVLLTLAKHLKEAGGWI